MALEKEVVVNAQMCIRKPVEVVFEAFIDPDITTRFWFTRSSGKLESGKAVRWEWEMYGAVADIQVIAIEENKRILIEWDEPARPVEWLFTRRDDNTTLVTITERGYQGSDDDIVTQAIDSKGGFTMVLAGLKAFLENGIAMPLVADQFPDAHVDWLVI